jgi:hypothetical protein
VVPRDQVPAVHQFCHRTPGLSTGRLFSADHLFRDYLFPRNPIGTPLAIDDGRDSKLARSTGLVWNLERDHRISNFPPRSASLASKIEVRREEAMPQGPDELRSPGKRRKTFSKDLEAGTAQDPRFPGLPRGTEGALAVAQCPSEKQEVTQIPLPERRPV